jgi:hypothetical protein
MNSLLKAKVDPRDVAEILAAIGIVLWRIVTSPEHAVWRDWISLLAVYWIVAVVLKEKRALIPVTAVFGAALMGLYLCGHYPHAVEFLRTVR